MLLPIRIFTSKKRKEQFCILAVELHVANPKFQKFLRTQVYLFMHINNINEKSHPFYTPLQEF